MKSKTSPRVKKGRAVASHVGRPFKARPWADDLKQLYILEGLPVRAVAARLGVSKDLIHRALKEAKIALRPRVRKSRLLKVEPARILSEIIDRGADKAAVSLGVSRRTLYRNLKRIKGRP